VEKLAAPAHPGRRRLLAELDPAVEWHPVLTTTLGGEATVYRGHKGVRELFLVSENSTSYGKDLAREHGGPAALAALLPFRSLFGTPLSIYTGVLSGDAVIPAIGLQLFWLAALGLISRWFWGRIQARIEHGQHGTELSRLDPQALVAREPRADREASPPVHRLQRVRHEVREHLPDPDPIDLDLRQIVGDALGQHVSARPDRDQVLAAVAGAALAGAGRYVSPRPGRGPGAGSVPGRPVTAIPLSGRIVAKEPCRRRSPALSGVGRRGLRRR